MENENAISILEHMKNRITTRVFEEEALDVAIQKIKELQKWQMLAGTVEKMQKSCKRNYAAGHKHGYYDGYIRATKEFAESVRLYGCAQEYQKNREMADIIESYLNDSTNYENFYKNER